MPSPLAKISYRLRRALDGQREHAPVLMFHVGRSGSSVLADLLNQTWRDVFWAREVHERVLRERFGPGRDADGVFHPLEPGVLADLDPFDTPRRERVAAAPRLYGCEAKFFHLRLLGMEIADYVERARAEGFRRFVILERRNTLRKVVSSLMAQQRGAYHVLKGQTDGGTPERLSLDVEAVSLDRRTAPLVRFLKGYRDDFATLRRVLADDDVLEISYEDHIEHDPTLAYGRFCAWAGVRPAPVEVNHRRTTPQPLRDLLADPDAVRAHLVGSGLEWMVDG